MLVFNKRGRDRKEKYGYNSRIIEEILKFKYLGFVINNKEKYKEYKELSRKERIAVRKMWGLEEGICRNDF